MKWTVLYIIPAVGFLAYGFWMTRRQIKSFPFDIAVALFFWYWLAQLSYRYGEIEFLPVTIALGLWFILLFHLGRLYPNGHFVLNYLWVTGIFKLAWTWLLAIDVVYAQVASAIYQWRGLPLEIAAEYFYKEVKNIVYLTEVAVALVGITWRQRGVA